MLPTPAGLREAVTASRTALTAYLLDAFGESFGVRPREVTYESFPEGLFAGLLLDGTLTTEHNVWAVSASTELRSAGVDVNVFVRASSELEEAERSFRRAEGRVRARLRRSRP